MKNDIGKRIIHGIVASIPGFGVGYLCGLRYFMTLGEALYAGAAIGGLAALSAFIYTDYFWEQFQR